jgi:hypothetical protein
LMPVSAKCNHPHSPSGTSVSGDPNSGEIAQDWDFASRHYQACLLPCKYLRTARTCGPNSSTHEPRRKALQDAAVAFIQPPTLPSERSLRDILAALAAALGEVVAAEPSREAFAAQYRRYEHRRPTVILIHEEDKRCGHARRCALGGIPATAAAAAQHVRAVPCRPATAQEYT